MRNFLTQYFNSWWLPAFLYICIFIIFSITVKLDWGPLVATVKVQLWLGGLAFLGIIATSIWNLIKKRWKLGLTNLLLVVGCGVATLYAFWFFILAYRFFGPIEDGFADKLTIPDGIEIADPDFATIDVWGAHTLKGSDELQNMVRDSLAIQGSDIIEFAPNMPSLRKASTDHLDTFVDYIEASPDWHVFIEQGNRFAVRRWSYKGEPRETLHGYISEFNGNHSFQTRCLLCLDRKQWSRYSVQHVQEGDHFVKPNMSIGNNQHMSRVMIECGGIWVEVFEESGKLERRVTKATVSALEKEFSAFLSDPKDAVAKAQIRSRELASRLAGNEGHPFRLMIGMQPGIYSVSYYLNPGESGSVYLKAFEVTKGTPLSVSRLEATSKTRMTWSTDISERFGAKAGFMIYEGDWGKPYAARFEVWFRPDSGKSERKLAERIFKIEGWQR